MKTLLEKDDFSQDDINKLIESELEESIHIEFKHAEALSKTDSKKKEISKDISAFANSDGGLIFYGINEINYKASGRVNYSCKKIIQTPGIFFCSKTLLAFGSHRWISQVSFVEVSRYPIHSFHSIDIPDILLIFRGLQKEV